jgi:tRNA G18 (ribose-2'-O)-methylase SpoU
MEELDRLSVSDMQQAAKHPLVLVLDDVRSMHNVGSAFRTADAFAVTSICLCGYTPNPPHRDIHKTALGATETVHWQHFSHTVDAVKTLKAQGYKIYAVEQSHNSTLLQDVRWDRRTPVALVFGNEVNGVSDEVMALADACIEIPQWGTKHSLNISVTVGVVLWQMVAPAKKPA